MALRVVLQARSNSARLPGKALLPIGGMPMALLAASRAGNSGLPLVLATSTAPSDDRLCDEAARLGIPLVRGPLDDVLERFLVATNDLGDDDVVVRLTADNVLPDGPFLEGLIAARADRELPYLATHSPADGLPFGLSAEAFTTGALREADRFSARSEDREHVTPMLRRRYPRAIYSPAGLACVALSKLRATVDDMDDYQRMYRLFAAVADPVHAPLSFLLQRLSIQEEFVLGTAQLGLAGYGAANRTIGMTDAGAVTLINTATALGISQLDTARAYGAAEPRLGAALAVGGTPDLRLITKLSPLSQLDVDTQPAVAARAASESVLESLRALQRQRLDVLLLHRAVHRTSWDGAVWERLKRWQDDGSIERLGVSCQTPDEALAALVDPSVGMLQIPLNLADHRWVEARFPEARRKRPDVVVHARSVFLQGLLVAEHATWPNVDDRQDEWRSAVRQASELFGRSTLWLAINVVRSFDWIDALVLGIDDATQLEESARCFGVQPFDGNEWERARQRLPRASTRLLDPSQWTR